MFMQSPIFSSVIIFESNSKSWYVYTFEYKLISIRAFYIVFWILISYYPLELVYIRERLTRYVHYQDNFLMKWFSILCCRLLSWWYFSNNSSSSNLRINLYSILFYSIKYLSMLNCFFLLSHKYRDVALNRKLISLNKMVIHFHYKGYIQ